MSPTGEFEKYTTGVWTNLPLIAESLTICFLLVLVVLLFAYIAKYRVGVPDPEVHRHVFKIIKSYEQPSPLEQAERNGLLAHRILRPYLNREMSTADYMALGRKTVVAIKECECGEQTVERV